jgi:IS1 family transposase
VAIAKRILWGTEEEIVAMIRTEQRGQTMNTRYVESRHGNDRKDKKRFARRSACPSKAVA